MRGTLQLANSHNNRENGYAGKNRSTPPDGRMGILAHPPWNSFERDHRSLSPASRPNLLGAVSMECDIDGVVTTAHSQGARYQRSFLRRDPSNGRNRSPRFHVFANGRTQLSQAAQETQGSPRKRIQQHEVSVGCTTDTLHHTDGTGHRKNPAGRTAQRTHNRITRQH